MQQWKAQKRRRRKKKTNKQTQNSAQHLKNHLQIRESDEEVKNNVVKHENHMNNKFNVCVCYACGNEHFSSYLLVGCRRNRLPPRYLSIWNRKIDENTKSEGLEKIKTQQQQNLRKKCPSKHNYSARQPSVVYAILIIGNWCFFISISLFIRCIYSHVPRLFYYYVGKYVFRGPFCRCSAIM